jgi:orotidine-5'-phosphate decarboxylase
VQDLRQFELGGLVCSPHEVKEVKRYWPGGFAMVPGVQQSPGLAADQVRTMTAREAWLAGADALVIGRSLLQSPDPRSLLDQMAADWPARREIGCAL